MALAEADLILRLNGRGGINALTNEPRALPTATSTSSLSSHHDIHDADAVEQARRAAAMKPATEEIGGDPIHSMNLPDFSGARADQDEDGDEDPEVIFDYEPVCPTPESCSLEGPDPEQDDKIAVAEPSFDDLGQDEEGLVEKRSPLSPLFPPSADSHDKRAGFDRTISGEDLVLFALFGCEGPSPEQRSRIEHELGIHKPLGGPLSEEQAAAAAPATTLEQRSPRGGFKPLPEERFSSRALLRFALYGCSNVWCSAQTTKMIHLELAARGIDYVLEQNSTRDATTTATTLQQSSSLETPAEEESEKNSGDDFANFASQEPSPSAEMEKRSPDPRHGPVLVTTLESDPAPTMPAHLPNYRPHCPFCKSTEALEQRSPSSSPPTDDEEDSSAVQDAEEIIPVDELAMFTWHPPHSSMDQSYDSDQADQDDSEAAADDDDEADEEQSVEKRHLPLFLAGKHRPFGRKPKFMREGSKDEEDGDYEDVVDDDADEEQSVEKRHLPLFLAGKHRPFGRKPKFMREGSKDEEDGDFDDVVVVEDADEQSLEQRSWHKFLPGSSEDAPAGGTDGEAEGGEHTLSPQNFLPKVPMKGTEDLQDEDSWGHKLVDALPHLPKRGEGDEDEDGKQDSSLDDDSTVPISRPRCSVSSKSHLDRRLCEEAIRQWKKCQLNGCLAGDEISYPELKRKCRSMSCYREHRPSLDDDSIKSPHQTDPNHPPVPGSIKYFGDDATEEKCKAMRCNPRGCMSRVKARRCSWAGCDCMKSAHPGSYNPNSSGLYDRPQHPRPLAPEIYQTARECEDMGCYSLSRISRPQCAPKGCYDFLIHRAHREILEAKHPLQ